MNGPETATTTRVSRRRFLRDGAATVLAAETLGPFAARGRSRQRKRLRPTVAVFGGGIAGLTAAHELIERGFAVSLFDQEDGWGGRVRSSKTHGTVVGGRQPLPGEHGIHVYFGAYRNLGDTMRRIPFGSNPNGVHDNLVAAPQAAYARAGKHPLVLPLGQLDPRPYTPAEVRDLLVSALLETDLPPQAVTYFADRLVVHLSSCDARRSGQWEHTTWTDFIAADHFTADYRKILGGFTEILWACKANQASADFTALTFETFLLYGLLGLGTEGPAIRVLNQPSNDAFIDPWVAVLRQFGATANLRHKLTGFAISKGRIVAAHLRTPHGHRTVHADWYVCALPVSNARRLWSRAILAADPRLSGMRALQTAQIPSIQFYLRERRPIIKGGVVCADAPWATEFIDQAQFWIHDFASSYGDGRARDCMSVATVNLGRPGILYGKQLEDCTPREFANDVWEQIKQHVNTPGEAPKLTDDMLVSWRLGDGVVRRKGKLISEEPHVIPVAGTARYRPDVATGIPNLMLCGDYLNGDHGVGYMEAANTNGRRAANAILASGGSHETPAKTIALYRPPEWEPLKRIDEQRYAQGQPNLFDINPVLGALPPQVLQIVGL